MTPREFVDWDGYNILREAVGLPGWYRWKL